MFNLKVYLACSSLATWHWDWTCASSLFNSGLDSMGHTRLFILNLNLATFWYLPATHLHVFFPSMACVSQEYWPCGYCTCLKVIIFMLFLIGHCEQSSSLDGSFPWCKVVCNKKFIINIYIFMVDHLPSALLCLLWIFQSWRMLLLVVTNQKMPLSSSRTVCPVLDCNTFFKTEYTNHWRHSFRVILM